MKKQKNIMQIQLIKKFSKNDKKAIDAGACKYLNFIAIALRKKNI